MTKWTSTGPRRNKANSLRGHVACPRRASVPTRLRLPRYARNDICRARAHDPRPSRGRALRRDAFRHHSEQALVRNKANSGTAGCDGVWGWGPWGRSLLDPHIACLRPFRGVLYKQTHLPTGAGRTNKANLRRGRGSRVRGQRPGTRHPAPTPWTFVRNKANLALTKMAAKCWIGKQL